MAGDDAFYRAAERRVESLTLGLGAAGAFVAALVWGGRPAGGVGVGAALAWVNYRWLKQGAAALAALSAAQADAPKVRIPKRVYVKFFGRSALFLGIVYVIFRYSILPLAAVLGGLFVVVAAVLMEMVYELVSMGERPHRG